MYTFIKTLLIFNFRTNKAAAGINKCDKIALNCVK